MITLKEAYFIAKRRAEYPLLYVCADLGDCWQFDFVPEGVNSENIRAFAMDAPVGRGTPTVDKATGRYWEYYPQNDKAALMRRGREALKIPIEELTKYDDEFEETNK